MIYGSISHGNKGPLIVFEKDWSTELGYTKKTINSDVYCIYICPNIKAFAWELWQTLQYQPILVEDNASIYSAKVTRLAWEQNGMLIIEWPANSPNLNLIENIWRLLKGEYNGVSLRRRRKLGGTQRRNRRSSSPKNLRSILAI